MITRVAQGGYYIAPEVIERRYWQGIRLLFNKYLPLVDEAWLFDTSTGKPVLLARKLLNGFDIVDDNFYCQLRNQYAS